MTTQPLSEKMEIVRNRITNNNTSQGCKTKMLVQFMEISTAQKQAIQKTLKELKDKFQGKELWHPENIRWEIYATFKQNFGGLAEDGL